MKLRLLRKFVRPCSLFVLILLVPLFGGVLPRSIILIVADGAGIGHHTLSYYHNDRYSPAAFQHVGLMATHPIDRLKVTDSAASATAMATGVKTYKGAIGVDHDKQPRKTVLEYAQEQGMATGLVATSSITHATPAAFAAHVESRRDQDDIARQLAKADITVLLGAGSEYFLPKELGGVQDVNLLEAMASRGVQVVDDLDEAVDNDRPVIGLFAERSLPRAPEGRQPTTAAMARKALEILDADPDGFFLFVEESQVDWGGHGNDPDYVQAEMASLNDLIDTVLAYQEANPEVLVVLVADHETGGLVMQPKVVGSGHKAEWSTKGHTASLVPIFAIGPGGEAFDAVIDNTFIGLTLIEYITSR
ncbi:MAG: alkaline phosphatase [Fidelibacterota bacterium]|nr:MAG: alkaline phosphatase [Candidatus Neomarinimicrobiota bacterium]